MGGSLRAVSVVIVGAIIVVLSGCGPRLVPVSGRVTMAGKPVKRGHIWFVPDMEKGAKHSNYTPCALGADGSYALKTEERPGILPGPYKVVIFATNTEPPENPTGWVPDWLVPAKYADQSTSGLAVEIPDSAEPVIHNFDLKP